MNIESKTKKYLDKINIENRKINAILHLNHNALEEAAKLDKKQKKGRLAGKIIGVKSNINVEGLITNCASKVLENYIATYNATVIEKIKAEDGIIIGMCNMDEFAAGSSGENSAFGPTQNPSAHGKITGGSSSGSAAAVVAGFCDMALGSDTGGSIRNPASHCGIVGIKPSYGLVSRYGLIDLSMSLDQIGVLAKTVEDAALLLNIIKGKDKYDSTTFESLPINISAVPNPKLGILKINEVDKKIQNKIDRAINNVSQKNKWKVQEIKITNINLAVQTYYLLVYAEFFSATRKFDGRRYGKKIEEACGKEVLRRILGGSEITKAEYANRFYYRALLVKELIKKEFEEAFNKVDCIIIPTCPNLPWKIGEGTSMKTEEVYTADALTIPANLAEICAISIPAGKVEDVPVGMQILCAKGKDSQMLSIAKIIENHI